MVNNDSADAEAERVLNPIACGHCRQRKRKCDRKLPHCHQCSHDPSSCHYPEQNKRGMPIGFINQLEARLAETEQALFNILYSQESRSTEAFPLLNPQLQRKADRIKEWEALPLSSIQEIRNWYLVKQNQSDGVDQQLILDNPSHQTNPPVMNPSLPNRSVNTPDPVSSGRDTPPSLPHGGDDMIDVTWETPETAESKAKDLGKRRPHMYF